MSEAVINQFEMINVNHQKTDICSFVRKTVPIAGQRLETAPDAGQILRYGELEKASIFQASQRIRDAKPFQIGIRHRQFHGAGGYQTLQMSSALPEILHAPAKSA